MMIDDSGNDEDDANVVHMMVTIIMSMMKCR